MTVARSTLIDAQLGGTYHCISRCVRRAFLCGDGWEHRKSWIEQRIRFLSQRFAMDVMAYADLNPIRAKMASTPEYSPTPVCESASRPTRISKSERVS